MQRQSYQYTHVPLRASRTVMQQPDIEEDDDAYYSERLPTSAIRYTDTRGNQVVQRGKQRIVIHNEPPPPKKSRHWLLFVGLGMIAMVGLSIAASALLTWWSNHQLDAVYGFPRTYQVDEVIGHSDSS